MPRSSAKTKQTWFSRGKDVVLFLGGCAGMVWEAGFVPEPRTILVTAYLVLLGFPVFNSIDRLFQNNNREEDE